MVQCRWVDKEAGVMQVEANPNHRWEVRLDAEGREWFNREGCTCRPLPMVDMHIVMVGGEGDCPVHG